MEKMATLVAFTRWGYVCENCEFPNKTQAIKQGRYLKSNDYAFSFKVYQKDERGKYKLIAKG